MKSYGQYCALARGLDVIGDRWLLLIVRELLVGPRRFGELRHGLPGIASNLLSERLRAMQDNGLVVKADDRYRLTGRGEDLREVVSAVGGWAAPLMDRMAEGDAFRGHWLALPVADLFPGVDPGRPELTVEVRCDDEPVTLRSAAGRVTMRPGRAAAPDLVLTGPPDAAFGLLAHRIDPAEARARGLAVTGDAGLLDGLRPDPRGARSTHGELGERTS
ncbi:helix-turn-helix domain-containing protein [Streptomyces sp. WMMC500]|uniref:winged helix-turn-helix transcriptional regulator n=1 Tax=Streptomyces sp. WMMC500 TaxID=3015154 RepID=UPI00248D2D28|nr:helix-turn-helix domain-containing protein [Streptomyces sp. WMMC500]WBB58924.1 helix-turn-helix domain-containing protein [Streptomyces sp. WMMC500]